MSTKDYIYLGLLILAAVVFYCHGFYSGVCRSRGLYEDLRNRKASDRDFAEDDQGNYVEAAYSRQYDALLPRLEVRGDYKNN